MAGPSSDYHRGEMDIAEQTKTFHLIMGMTKWGSLVLAAFLLVVVLATSTNVGLLGSLAWGVALLVIGIFGLREKPTADH